MHLPGESVERILLVRPRFLGDICLTLPALDAVRAACPRARVAYLVEEESAPLLEGDPRVDERIVTSRRPSAAAWGSTVSRLRRFAPQVALDFFCNPRTAIWTFLSGARVRVGYPGKGWRSSLYTHHVRPRTLSAIGFHLASVAALGWDAPHGVPRLHVTEEAREAANLELEKAGVSREKRLIGFHPGARWPTRQWGVGNFIDLARRALKWDPQAVAVVTGAGNDVEDVGQVVEALPDRRAIAILDWPLEHLVALQARCEAFVAGDSGPMHSAVATGTPTLGLLSRNRPAMFFPYPESHGHRAYYARVECSPCHRDVCDDMRCMKRLAPEGAWELLSGMLRARRARESA